MPKSIAIIGTVGLPASYGGFETLTEHLTTYLGDKYEITVYCSSKNYINRPSLHNKARLIYIPLSANGVQSIPYDILSMVHALRRADLLLILGVSGCIALPFIRLLTNKKFIINIDGTEWKRDKWNKAAKWFLKLSERLAVKYAHAIITDNLAVQRYVKSEYSTDSTFIAYGADHVHKLELSREILNTYDYLQHGYVFSVCRIEPENNIHIILEALSKQQELHAVIVGNWDFSSYGAELRLKYAAHKHLHLLDPIYDQHKLNQLRSNCLIYLHGHSAGGTNPSLVEAMFLGLPVFAFAAIYNVETTENRALYFSSSEELSALIADTDRTTLIGIGQKMSEIANRRYRWDIITQQYDSLFYSLIES